MKKPVTVLLAASLIFITACSGIRKFPETKLPEDLPAAWKTDFPIERLPVTSGLLDLFDDKRLRVLVNEAVSSNPNLKATALRLRASNYLLSGTGSKLLPRADIDFSREKSDQGVDALTGKRIHEDKYRVSLGVSWEIDLWGRLADEHAASKHAFYAQEHDYLHARDALAARVIQMWVELAAVRRSLAMEKKRLGFLQRIEEVAVERYRSGVGTFGELSDAKSCTEVARADISEQKAAFHRSIRSLEVLLGRYPTGQLLSNEELPSIAHPHVEIPAVTLLKRPDIRVALERVISAQHLSRSAEKAMLPQLSLSGKIFKESASLNAIAGSAPYWGVLGSLFQPLFESGRIINESRARKVEVEAELAGLYETVLRALKEVEDALSNEQELEIQSHALRIAVRESEKSSRYHEERYRQGLDNIQDMLRAKEQEVAARLRLNDVDARRLSNRIEMSLALGQGFSNHVQKH